MINHYNRLYNFWQFASQLVTHPQLLAATHHKWEIEMVKYFPPQNPPGKKKNATLFNDEISTLKVKVRLHVIWNPVWARYRANLLPFL